MAQAPKKAEIKPSGVKLSIPIVPAGRHSRSILSATARWSGAKIAPKEEVTSVEVAVAERERLGVGLDHSSARINVGQAPLAPAGDCGRRARIPLHASWSSDPVVAWPQGGDVRFDYVGAAGNVGGWEPQRVRRWTWPEPQTRVCQREGVGLRAEASFTETGSSSRSSTSYFRTI
ncbi:MAG TPA: hypothetical protein VHF45_09510 [Thermoleophilaceae bacterium]|nr:hypothetical protein [Thermoleophilaceae bacterium]